MELSKFATKLAAKNHFVKASIGGFQGSGKSLTATKFIIGCYKDLKLKKPILIIDNEKGSRFLIKQFKKAGIEALVKDSKQLQDVREAFNYLKAGEIDFLFIDSLTKVYYQFIKDYKKKNNKQNMSLMDWGKMLPSWQENFSDVFVEAEGNILFTGRGGFEYSKEEDTKNEAGEVTEKGQFVKSGMKMKIAGETPYETDLNIWMQLEDHSTNGKGKPEPKQTNVAYVLKDRSDTINAKSFHNPVYKNFQPVIKFITGLEVGEVAGENESANNYAPGDDFSYLREKTKRQIQTELISAEFDKVGLGDCRSKADKQLKTVILEKVFATASPTEIDKMSAVKLEEKRQLLVILFDELQQAQAKDEKIVIMDFVKSYSFDLLVS